MRIDGDENDENRNFILLWEIERGREREREKERDRERCIYIYVCVDVYIYNDDWESNMASC